ncbi:MAG: FAD-binding oxidoreductase [Chitinophagaceae bacterium]|nr:FAD-binding oxidoreductase [Chitinophagaceae bacterium]
MISYWEQKTFYHHRHLIICGAGFTGLSAAIYFKRKFPGKDVLVIEKDPVNGGASTKNAGFACFGSASELLADLKKLNEEKVFHLVSERIRGLQNLRNLLGDENIGYEPLHGFELFRHNDGLYENCLDHLDYLNEKVRSITGSNVYNVADKKIKIFGFENVEHIIENEGEGQVDTGKMYLSLLQLARESGIEILNGILINRYDENDKCVILDTTYGKITGDKFLIANNGFASQILKDSHTIPARAQVLITSVIKDLKVKGSFHMDEGFYYFRNIDGRVLFGGGRNLDFETETTAELNLNEMIQAQLEKILHEIILPDDDFKIEQRWSGIMGFGDEKQIICKQISEGVFCAVRLNGMGLALSTLLGKEVAEMMG